MQLERALSHQDTVSSKIGEILVTLGYLSEEDVIAALAEQFSVELYQPEDDDEFVIPQVAELFHRNHQFALIRRSGDVDEESDGGTDPAYNEVGDVAGAMGKRILLVSDPTDGNLFAALDVVSPGDYEIQLGPEAILKKIMGHGQGCRRQHRHRYADGNIARHRFTDGNDHLADERFDLYRPRHNADHRRNRLR